MLELTSKIQEFREELYKLFIKRPDSIMNLLDAISSNAHQCDSVVKLSTSSVFQRAYSSITDAVRWPNLSRLKIRNHEIQFAS